jgi:hypothetical protein
MYTSRLYIYVLWSAKGFFFMTDSFANDENIGEI